ncbi:NEL-type E3 ubiquitin ligase domain-containing protein [Pseudomonas fluorescens]|uniref:NEL-type E3 ubiquitin ligase domain-containing protein n=1 Tax=Pseudomonas fluorescens TaxID=294 RepID=UPI000ADB5F55|nr:NEL-type E3 ubiquitin ligase domain-containing protein [Pseudomonas fluorescens]
MPIKSPSKGIDTGVPTVRPNPATEVTPPRPDTPRANALEPTLTVDSPLRPNSPTVPADLDAIRPALVVTVQPTDPPAEVLRAVTQPLRHYRLTAASTLPEVDAEGLRTYKGRQYVDVADGGVVLVSKDPETGLYRARLPSESKPSGPALLRDPDSAKWHELELFEPVTFALSATRLEPFRTALDFSTRMVDSDGLHRFNGKLYAVIDQHSYQVLHDLDASTPLTTVMRIVRPEDPVASDSNNVYVATRPGRSEPVVLDPRDGWVAINIAGAGGMRRSQSERLAGQSLADRLGAFARRLRSPESRARTLFPTYDNPQIAAYLRSLGDDVANGLALRENAYKNLKEELQAWAQASASTAQGWVELATKQIKRCWRHETGSTLKLPPGGGFLPSLTADFNHVRTLELNAHAWSDSAEAFLKRFTGLEHLTLSGCGLKKLPTGVAEMNHLSSLNLRANGLQLDASSADRLSLFTRLESLVLSDNPLGHLPDFSGLSRLKVLDLNSTAIDQWPAGLTGLLAAERIDLRNNRLSEVPADRLNPPDDQLEAVARLNQHIWLEGNPFPEGYWRQFELFWQRVEQNQPQLSVGFPSDAFRLEKNITEVSLAQSLNPGMDVSAAKKHVMQLGDNAMAKLVDRQQARVALDTQLATYVDENAHLPLYERSRIRDVVRDIQRSWLKRDGSVLDLSFVAAPTTDLITPLPALTGDFSHVHHLSLNGFMWTTGADTFLANFTQLQSLSITGSTLDTLPASLAETSDLSILELGSNRIELDEQNATRLSTFSRLTRLDLSHNPLKITPDFSAMPTLTSLMLNDTGIGQWPAGLRDKTALQHLDLRNNRLTEVPEENLNPTAEQFAAVARINAVTLLEGNDFPADYSAKFDSFWRRVHATHPELASPFRANAFDSGDSAVQRYQRLYPGKPIKECREYIWSLEPDVAATRLASLEQEFSGLTTQLDAWVFSGGGGRQRYIRAGQLGINAGNREDRYSARARILSCWRRETVQKVANDGTPIGFELNLSGLTLQSLPDLDIDFSHVGSLRLSDMQLSASPEGFLTRFRHVRWLDLSLNQLRELPPAIAEMRGLTRLFLQKNQISLTADSARILSQQSTLRALWLHDNPQLGIAPDFSRIADMRSLDLMNTGIDTYPTGLHDQPLLDMVRLNRNRIAHIPDAVIAPPDNQLAQTLRVNNVTNITGNPLADETRGRLTVYNNRLIAAGTPMTGPDNLFVTSTRIPGQPVHRLTPNLSVQRWLRGMPAEQVSARTAQWQTLRDQPGANGLFDTFERLLDDVTGHADLQRRVWSVIDSITENSPESESLRKDLFDRAGSAACCDRAAFTFSNLENRALMYRARAQATDQNQGPQLAQLSKALFRLHEVDKIASADIAQREADIARSRTPQQALTLPAPHVSEEVEIRLFYRHALKDRLQLLGQPERMGFAHLVKVSTEQLENAFRSVTALDNSPQEFTALVSRDFWQEFIVHKYRTQFEAQRLPFQDQQTSLDETYANKALSFSEYDTRAKALQSALAKEEEALIATLTRQELREQSTRNAAGQAAGGSA